MFPILINSPWLVLYSYPFFMGIGWAMGYIVSENQLQKYLPNEKKILPYIFLAIFLSSWVGSKILFLMVTTPLERVVYARATNFWLGGGFVFYGGLIGALSTVLLTKTLLKKRLTWDFYKLLLPGLILGHAIGRIGCLLAGCCYGSLSDSILAVNMNGERRFPVQALEAIALFVIYKIVMRLCGQKKLNDSVAFYFVAYGIVRFILEFLRADEIRGIYFYLSTSQWVSVLLIILGITIRIKGGKVSLPAL